MESANESFTISSQETLLLHIHNDQKQQPIPSKKPRIKNPKTIIFFVLLILVTLIAASTILSSIYKKTQKPNAYLSGSSRYFCHLTPYSELCYSSMSSLINTTDIQSNPGQLFPTSLQVAINALNNTAVSITKALSSPMKTNPRVGPKLSMCQRLVHESLSLLTKSLGLLGNESDFESYTYSEMDRFRAWTKGAADNAGKCFLAVEEIEGKMGVEEVKLGVEKANNLIANSIWLFDGREYILSDFYNQFFTVNDDYYYYNYQIFRYRDLVWFYSVMYLFLALLYCMFWMGY